MKQRALALIHGLRPSFRRGRRWLVLLLLAVVLAPPSARAAGIGDILTLCKTITSTIQVAIGGALSGIQTLNSTINNFRQQIIWPLAQINQERAFVTSTRAQYGGLMSQIHGINLDSSRTCAFKVPMGRSRSSCLSISNPAHGRSSGAPCRALVPPL